MIVCQTVCQTIRPYFVHWEERQVVSSCFRSHAAAQEEITRLRSLLTQRMATSTRRGTNGEPTWNQREATGLWMILAEIEISGFGTAPLFHSMKNACVCVCEQMSKSTAYIKQYVLAVGCSVEL